MISETLYKIGLLAIVLLFNTIIAYTCASVTMYFCLVAGWNKSLTLILTIGVAVLVMFYIRFNHLLLISFRNGEKK